MGEARGEAAVVVGCGVESVGSGAPKPECTLRCAALFPSLIPVANAAIHVITIPHCITHDHEALL